MILEHLESTLACYATSTSVKRYPKNLIAPVKSSYRTVLNSQELSKNNNNNKTREWQYKWEGRKSKIG